MNGSYSPDSAYNNGYASGLWIDGGTVYPGTGNFASCSGNNPAGALIRVKSPRGPGAYESSGSKCFDGVNAQYYFRSSNLAWFGTNKIAVAGVLNAVVAGGNKIGRINVSAPNGTLYRSIGRIFLGTLYYYREGDATELTSNGPYDVLVCN